MNLDILLFLSNYQWVALTGEKINYSFAETIYGDEFVLIFQKTVGINANGWAKNYLSDIAIFLTYMIFFHTYCPNIRESNSLEITGRVF